LPHVPTKPEVVELSSGEEEEYFSSGESYEGDNDSEIEEEDPVAPGPGRSYGLSDSFFEGDTTEMSQLETPTEPTPANESVTTNEPVFTDEPIVIIDSDDEADTNDEDEDEDGGAESAEIDYPDWDDDRSNLAESSAENSIIIEDSDEDEDPGDEEDEEEEVDDDGDEPNVTEPPFLKQVPDVEKEPTVMDAPTSTNQPTAVASPVEEKVEYEEGWTGFDHSLFGTTTIQLDEGENNNGGNNNGGNNAPILLSSDSSDESSSEADEKLVHIKEASFYDHAASSVGEPSDDDGTGKDVETTYDYDNEDTFVEEETEVDEVSYEGDDESVMNAQQEGIIPIQKHIQDSSKLPAAGETIIVDEYEDDEGGSLTEEEALAGLSEGGEERAIDEVTINKGQSFQNPKGQVKDKVLESVPQTEAPVADEVTIDEDQSFQNAKEQVKDDVLESTSQTEAPVADEVTINEDQSFQNAKEQVKNEVLKSPPQTEAPVASETTLGEESFITTAGDLTQEAVVDPETKDLNTADLTQGEQDKTYLALPKFSSEKAHDYPRFSHPILEESFDDTVTLEAQLDAALRESTPSAAKDTVPQPGHKALLDETVVVQEAAKDKSPPPEQLARQERESSVIKVTTEVKTGAESSVQNESKSHADMSQGVLVVEDSAGSVDVKDESDDEEYADGSGSESGLEAESGSDSEDNGQEELPADEAITIALSEQNTTEEVKIHRTFVQEKTTVFADDSVLEEVEKFEEDIYEETFGEATEYDAEPTEADEINDAIQRQMLQTSSPPVVVPGPVNQAIW